ncbi:uncharacterized protein LOC120528793 [Tachysurus ichikawai]
MGSHIYAIPKAYCQATGVAPDPLPSVSLSKLQEAQKSDPVIGEVWQAISLKKPVGKNKWSSCPYVVEGQLADLPVYRLNPVDSREPVKVLHRNHILPLGREVRLSPVGDTLPEPRSRVGRHKIGAKRRDAEPKMLPPESHHDENSSDSDSEFGCFAEDAVQNVPMRETDLITQSEPTSLVPSVST